MSPEAGIGSALLFSPGWGADEGVFHADFLSKFVERVSTNDVRVVR
jgi:hypothetical protein